MQATSVQSVGGFGGALEGEEVQLQGSLFFFLRLKSNRKINIFTNDSEKNTFLATSKNEVKGMFDP